jgi:hypothetical protein
MTAPTQPVTTPPVNRKALEIALRTAGALVAVWGGALLGIYATFMTPFRIGTVLIPVALVLAIGGNAVLIWFGFFTTRNKFLALLPGLAWAAFAFLGAGRTNEGDILLTSNNWVATTYLFAGSITIAVAAYRLIVPKPQLPNQPSALRK